MPNLFLSGYASIGSYPKALAALGMMNKFSIKIEVEISKQILKMFLRETGPENVRKCLRALLLINGLSDNDSIQLLTSTYMKSIDFVKGAVSMDTLPPAECAEVRKWRGTSLHPKLMIIQTNYLFFTLPI